MVYVLYMTSPESFEAAGFVQVFQRAAPAAYLDRLSLEHGLTVRRGIYSLAAVIWLMIDRKSTRLNPSHLVISYAVFCLKKTRRIGCVQVVGGHDPGLDRHGEPEIGNGAHGFSKEFGWRDFFFFNDTAANEIYPLSLPDALPE